MWFVPQADVRGGPPPYGHTMLAMPRRDQLTFMVFGPWAIAGLFLDGWSHRHGKPNTFFTPWHGILYSAVAFSILWSVLDGRRRQRAGEVLGGFDVAGARLSAVGAALLVAGGMGDMVWHTLFGVEKDVAALLSPTHLLLLFGGVLAVTAPLRNAWVTDTDGAPTLRVFLPVIVSASLMSGLAAFFTQFSSPFLVNRLTLIEYQAQEIGVTGLLIATVVLVAPLLGVARRWRTPPGAFTVYFALIAALVAGLEAYHRWPLVLPLVITGAVADGLVEREVPLSALGAALPAVLWTTYFAFFALTGGMRWSAELWSGSVVMASMLGLGLAQLVSATGSFPGSLAGDAVDRDVEDVAGRGVVHRRILGGGADVAVGQALKQLGGAAVGDAGRPVDHEVLG